MFTLAIGANLRFILQEESPEVLNNSLDIVITFPKQYHHSLNGDTCISDDSDGLIDVKYEFMILNAGSKYLWAIAFYL